MLDDPSAELAAKIDAIRARNHVLHALHRWLAGTGDPTVAQALLRDLALNDRSAAPRGATALVTRGDGSNVRLRLLLRWTPEQWFPAIADAHESPDRDSGSLRPACSGEGVNRVLATLYAWLGLMEGSAAPVGFARDLLTDDARLTSSRGVVIAGVEELVSWVAQQRRGIVSSAHLVRELRIDPTASGWSVSVEFGWFGITAAGPSAAVTRHRWLVDETSQAYARIAAMDIDLVEPFAAADARVALSALAAFADGNG